MNNPFERIYSTNEWGHGSGEGSLEIHTADYAKFLEKFIGQKNIASVVDAGCGDWQFSKNINWQSASYSGYDVVASVVAENTSRYANARTSFVHYLGDPQELPPADLLICKDVLQHLPNRNVAEFLNVLARFKYCLITNCINPRGLTANDDIKVGEFRYLALRQPPFNLAARQVFTFQKQESLVRRWFRPSWKKEVLLVSQVPTGA